MIEERVPDTQRRRNTDFATMSAVAGLAVIMALGVASG